MSEKILPIDAAKFTLACVQSSPAQFSVKQKLDVYKEAFSKAKEIIDSNNKILDAKNEQDEAATREALEKFFN